MRSLLISGSYFPPQVGGISTMMAEICAGLGEERVAVLTGVRGNWMTLVLNAYAYTVPTLPFARVL